MRAKLINESLYSFEKKTNHLSSLGIGKKDLIEKWLDKNIRNFVRTRCIINDDYTIDSHISITLYLDKDVKELPEYIQFNEINGDFDISENHLTSLRGCPRIILGNFWCYGNDVEFSKEYIKSMGISVEQNIFNKK